MKICIFGADGRTGKEVLNVALNEGHEVTAFVFVAQKDEVFLKTKVIEGDVTNYSDVEKAVSGCDVVISVVGHIKGSDPFMQTKGISNITKAMENFSLKRIVSLTGTGVRFDGDRPSVLDKIGNFIIKIIDRERIIDGINHADVLKNSGLDWTVLRVLKLSQQDINFDGYHLTENGPAENLTPRKKVAKILVDLATSSSYIKKAPVVSKK